MAEWQACWAQQAGGPETWIVVLTIAVVLLVGVLAILWRHPISLLRLILRVITHTVYRIRVAGRELIPSTGPALFVCNHVSYIDWLLLLVTQRRFIRFVVWAPSKRLIALRLLMRWADVIAIDGAAESSAVEETIETASAALKRGELVCIFAEGRISRNGFLLPFHRGYEEIVRRAPVPVIPVCMDHLWGSIFSYRTGKVLWKWPLELPYHVCIAFGAPLPATASAAEVRLAIQKLSADCAVRITDARRVVHRHFVRRAARHPFRSCILDPNAPLPSLNYGKTLAAAMSLARVLRPVLADDKMVGVWLPASAGGAVTNIALALLGKTSVNLNYTASADSIHSAIRQCGVRNVLTSHRFTAKVALDTGPDATAVYLEDYRPKISRFRMALTYLKVVLLPGFVLERLLGVHRHRLDDLATIIFSSGSTGEPKGVMLSHRNIAANAESMVQAIDVTETDRVLGTLPFFHSFGYTVTLWVPLQVGASTVYYPDPRQGKEIGELCRKYEPTIVLTTPTFLRFYLRRAEPGDFDSVRMLVCGAEKLPPALAVEFKEKFGVLPLEGYGCTELSPTVAANVPDRDIDGAKQVGNKPGTIGQPLPGIAAKVVDPDTYETRPPGCEGLLLIYGANVMEGYLDKPELTEQVLRDGWYITGDMAVIDEDGFIKITGRLARFAKVGGEMVPLERIDDELQDALGTNDRVVAVTCVPDEAKGERLVVLHMPLNGTTPRFLRERLSDRGLPNLWVPAERDFYEVADLPILGSGKVNWPEVKKTALEKVRGKLARAI